MLIEFATVGALAAAGLCAGAIGALVGVGGGIIVVPTLVIGFGLDIRIAVASSLIAVVASSTAAGSVYVGKGLSNMRLAMFLEIATTLGGISGGLIAVYVSAGSIAAVFGALLIIVAALMVRDTFASPRRAGDALNSSIPELGDSATSGPAGQMDGDFYDEYEKRHVHYRVRRLPLGFGISYLAGILSGLLGVGGGFMKVPAMNMGMHVPMKVATATSNFMIGVTAVSSLFVYFARGYVHPLIAAPVAVGVVGGALFGTRIAARISPVQLKRVFAVLLILIALQMMINGGGMSGGH